MCDMTMKTLILSTIALTILLTGCASQRPARVATATVAPIATVQQTASVAERSITRAIKKVEALPQECASPHVIEELQLAQAAVSDLKRGMAIILKENENLMKEATVLVGQIDKARRENSELNKKLAHVVRQRNQLISGVAVFVVAVLLTIFGPAIWRVLRLVIFKF